MNSGLELERARQAKEVLDNPVYADAADKLEKEIIAQWQASKDTKEREWQWTLLQAHKRLQAALKDTMLTGSLQSKQIELRRNRLEKAGRLLLGN
jgi:hypothetical protein